jgi:hypothetical protein
MLVSERHPNRPTDAPETHLTLLETLGKPAASVVAERCRFIQQHHQSSTLCKGQMDVVQRMDRGKKYLGDQWALYSRRQRISEHF